jgi:hypothetical protein
VTRLAASDRRAVFRRLAARTVRPDGHGRSHAGGPVRDHRAGVPPLQAGRLAVGAGRALTRPARQGPLRAAARSDPRTRLPRATEARERPSRRPRPRGCSTPLPPRHLRRLHGRRRPPDRSRRALPLRALHRSPRGRRAASQTARASLLARARVRRAGSGEELEQQFVDPLGRVELHPVASAADSPVAPGPVTCRPDAANATRSALTPRARPKFERTPGGAGRQAILTRTFVFIVGLRGGVEAVRAGWGYEWTNESPWVHAYDLAANRSIRAPDRFCAPHARVVLCTPRARRSLFCSKLRSAAFKLRKRGVVVGDLRVLIPRLGGKPVSLCVTRTGARSRSDESSLH